VIQFFWKKTIWFI